MPHHRRNSDLVDLVSYLEECFGNAISTDLGGPARKPPPPKPAWTRGSLMDVGLLTGLVVTFVDAVFATLFIVVWLAIAASALN